MRLGVVSDVHVEFHRDGGAAFLSSLPPVDVLVIAGDLGDSYTIIDALQHVLEAERESDDCGYRRYLHVVFVFGNHEFYGSSFAKVREAVEDFRLSSLEVSSRLHVIDNSTTEIGGHRFVGTTMWTRHFPGIKELESEMPDFQKIRERSESLYHENRQALRFLQATVEPGDIVVTHHLPAARSVAPEFVGSSLNAFFLCDMQPLIEERSPALWIHGHTHASCDYEIGRTRVICNPFGRVDMAINLDFRDDLVVEI